MVALIISRTAVPLWGSCGMYGSRTASSWGPYVVRDPQAVCPWKSCGGCGSRVASSWSPYGARDPQILPPRRSRGARGTRAASSWGRCGIRGRQIVMPGGLPGCCVPCMGLLAGGWARYTNTHHDLSYVYLPLSMIRRCENVHQCYAAQLCDSASSRRA